MEQQEIIRPSTAADIPLLSDLFREVFGTDRPDAVWRWKYFENPRGCASYLCVAGGRVVAHCGGTPVSVAEGGTVYPAFQSVDFMSSPSWAGGAGGGGVFVRTVRAFFRTYCGADRVPLVYGFPGERHRVLGERLLGYRAVDEIAEFAIPGISGGEGIAEPLRDEHLSLFALQWPGVAAVRDATYLAWRYLRHPLNRYGVVLARRAAAIVRRDEETLYVMELGGDISADSLRSLGSKLARFGQNVILWGSPQHATAAILHEAGFRMTTRGHSLACRYFTEHPLPAPGEFYFSLGDYDVY